LTSTHEDFLFFSRLVGEITIIDLHFHVHTNTHFFSFFYTHTPTHRIHHRGAFDKQVKKDDAFLEATPYYDQSNIPLQLFKAKEPLVGKIISVKRIVGAQATGETCDVIIDHMGKMPYWEGQSYGVVPPGINPKNGKPNTNRLYSIASTRYGDDFKGTTTTLCVRRATYWCPELKVSVCAYVN